MLAVFFWRKIQNSDLEQPRLRRFGLMTALDRKIASAVTPGIVAKGAMIFQPSDERRRSGSHYTPSSLTGPIVQAALEPVFKQLGDNPTPEQILALKVCDPAMGSGAFLVEACRQLGDALVRAWHAHNQAPTVPPDEDESLLAQRQVAQRCLYGVDKNPMAADLAKLSLWLATLAKDHPFTFLDHALRSGDSLVGLSRKQITAFHWDKTDAQQSFLEDTVRARLRRIGQYRQRILDARDLIPYAQLEQHLEAVDEDLGWLRRIGDTVIAAFFSAEKPKAREAARQGLRELTEKTVRSVVDLESNSKIEEAVWKLYAGPKGIRPFHWELEFPEVFRLDESGEPQGGFDVIVGNPPFLGGTRITSAHGSAYRDWLANLHPEGSSNSDLVAHFFRRTFRLLRKSGCMGLVATNSIFQGDTRVLGLQAITAQGGEIFSAIRRHPWPGLAAVVVSIIHIQRSPITVGSRFLDGTEVGRITAFLHTSGSNSEPIPLRSNYGMSFRGCDIFGIGFVFDDQNKNANSIAEMRKLIGGDARNSDRIFPFLGGEDFNSSPTLSPSRFIIDFGEMGEAEARTWPQLFEIVERRVKPPRSVVSQRDRRELWWLYATRSPGFRAYISAHERCLGIPAVTEPVAFGFVTGNPVVSHSLVTFALDSNSAFAVLQSRVHVLWAWFFSSSLEDRLRYAPSDCFETFPFPSRYEFNAALEAAGKAFYEFRAELMARNNEGLTRTYNRFHDPSENSPDIIRLRELHTAMDRAVLDAYSWQDIRPVCEFIPEFDDEEDEEDNGRPKKRKYRYKWPEAIHDEVLARLLELNRQRAEEERRETELETLSWENSAIVPTHKPKRARGKNGAKSGTIAEKPTLFNAEEQEV